MNSTQTKDPRRRRRSSTVRAVAACTIVIGMVALLAWGLLSKAPNTGIADSLAKGETASAPGFDLELLEMGGSAERLRTVWGSAANDGRIGLGELRGTPVVLNFWASWCTPCRQEAEVLQAGWEQARRRGVLFLGVNMEDARSDARGFLEEFNVTYPTLRESGRDTAIEYGATGFPETYFLTAGGRVADRHIGPIGVDELRAGIRAARTGQVGGAQSSAPKPGLRLVPVMPSARGQEPRRPTD